MTDTEIPNETPEEASESGGVMADALAGVAAMLRGEETAEEASDETIDEAAESGEEATTDAEASEEDFSDSPFAAAAAIFEQPEAEKEREAETEPEVETPEPETAVDDESETATGTTGEESDAAQEQPAEEAPAEEESGAEPVADTEEATAEEEAEVEASADEEGEPGEEDEDLLPPASPYDLPGGWYVIHSYSGYENKVKANLGTRIKSMHMEDSIFDIVIPMEDVVEIKGGRKVTVPRKQFPGYILVRMYMDDDSWGVVRNTPGVTGFVGSGTRPTSLSRREVERILGVRKDEEKKAPRFKPDWEVGETVRVIDGPFADFNGLIEDINLDQSKVRVLVDIFGRETPVELNFEQIQKF